MVMMRVMLKSMVIILFTGVLRSSSMMARAAADLNTGLNIAWGTRITISIAVRIMIIIFDITSNIIIIINIIIIVQRPTWLEAWLSEEAMEEDLTGDMSGLRLSSRLVMVIVYQL